MFNWAKRIFGRQSGDFDLQRELEARNLPENLFNGVKMLLVDRSNPEMSDQRILDELHKSPIFYACVALIASQVAGTDIFPTVNGERRDDHPLARRLEAPNMFHSNYTFMWLVTAYLLTGGNVYIYIFENGDLVPVPPTKVTHQTNLLYNVNIGHTAYKAVLGKNLVKLTLPDLREPYISGTGVGSALSKEIDIASAAQSHELSTLQNNARPDVLVNLAGADEQALRQYSEAWKQKHKGPHNAGKTGFTSADKMTVQTLTTSFKDLGFIELREFSNDTTRRTFGIPPELLGKSEGSNRATIDAAFFVFATMVLKPRLTQIVEGLNKSLLPLITTDKNVRLDFEEVIPENKEFSLSVMQAFPQAYKINDVRALTGHAPVVGGEAALEGGADLTPIVVELRPRLMEAPKLRMLPLLKNAPEELYFASLNRELLEKKKSTLHLGA